MRVEPSVAELKGRIAPVPRENGGTNPDTLRPAHALNPILAHRAANRRRVPEQCPAGGQEAHASIARGVSGSSAACSNRGKSLVDGDKPEIAHGEGRSSQASQQINPPASRVAPCTPMSRLGLAVLRAFSQLEQRGVAASPGACLLDSSQFGPTPQSG